VNCEQQFKFKYSSWWAGGTHDRHRLCWIHPCVYESSCIFILNWGSPDTRVRPIKNTCGSGYPTDPIFFLPMLSFFDAAKHAALFYPGGCGLLIQYSVPKWHLLSQLLNCVLTVWIIWLEKGFLHQCFTTKLWLKMLIPEKSTLLVNWLTSISAHVP
jgi:hypothetical protein